MKKTILITGSSGFLGSALCVDLSRRFKVIGVDRRSPSPLLKTSARGVFWERADIADREFAVKLKKDIFPRIGRIDAIIHFAAYYDFEKTWGPEYERVNVFGTEQMIKAALELGVKRLIFAGSIASLDPPPPGEVLNEKTPAGTLIPYSRSKAEGEALLARYADRLRSVVLRIGGVFSDWCELPPLYSLIKQWSQQGILGRLMPGKGDSGFPFIHRRDLVAAVRRIVEIEKRLDDFQVLFAAPPSHTTYREIYPIVRRFAAGKTANAPIHVPAALIGPFIRIKNIAAGIVGKETYERTWMLTYLDKPFATNSAYSRGKLSWSPSPQLSIQKRIPVIAENLKKDPSRWEERNILRSQGKYGYMPD